MRGENSNQNVVIALFLNIMFLNCTLQGFSYLSKPFCPRFLESAAVVHISKKDKIQILKRCFLNHFNPISYGLRHKTSKNYEK